MRLPIRGRYAKTWKRIAEKVKAAADWRCIRCGHPHETPKNRAACDDRCTHRSDGKQRMLTVHHLDGNKGNNRWWNLLALCQACHLSVQSRVMPDRPWLFEHSEWFKPYVAGYYAAAHGGVQLTRAEAEAELDLWLAVGQPWLVDTATWTPKENRIASVSCPSEGDPDA